MTEEERIFSGGLFAPEAPELVAKKRKAHRLSQDFNNLYEEDDEAREKILRELLCAVGRRRTCSGRSVFTMAAIRRSEAIAS